MVTAGAMLGIDQIQAIKCKTYHEQQREGMTQQHYSLGGCEGGAQDGSCRICPAMICAGRRGGGPCSIGMNGLMAGSRSRLGMRGLTCGGVIERSSPW
jgi:hypothetical protein